MKKLIVICALIAVCFSVESSPKATAVSGCPGGTTTVTDNNKVYCCWDAGAWWVCMPRDQE